MVPLKYLSNVWRTLEMPLSNCEYNLILTWSDKFLSSNDPKAPAFTITDTKLYVPVSSVKWSHLAHFESNLAKHNFLNQNPMGSSSTLLNQTLITRVQTPKINFL